LFAPTVRVAAPSVTLPFPASDPIVSLEEFASTNTPGLLMVTAAVSAIWSPTTNQSVPALTTIGPAMAVRPGVSIHKFSVPPFTVVVPV
jgi:hypothetical protein